MVLKVARFVAIAVTLVAGAVALDAQGRGGAPPGRGGGPAARGPRAGTVEHITVHGKALEGNLEGDSPDREVTVYLPPSYAGDQTRRYPGRLSAARLRRPRRHVHRPARQAPRKRGHACRRSGLQRADRRHTECVLSAQGQHVFELADHRRLGDASSRRIWSPTWTATTARSPTA